MDNVNWQPLLIKNSLQQSIYFNNSVDESKLCFLCLYSGTKWCYECQFALWHSWCIWVIKNCIILSLRLTNFDLNLLYSKSVYKFSELFSLNFLWHLQGEFVQQSRATWVCDVFLYLFYFYSMFDSGENLAADHSKGFEG